MKYVGFLGFFKNVCTVSSMCVGSEECAIVT